MIQWRWLAGGLHVGFLLPTFSIHVEVEPVRFQKEVEGGPEQCLWMVMIKLLQRLGF